MVLCSLRMDGGQRFPAGQSIIHVQATEPERSRLVGLEKVFNDNFCKMVKVIGEKRISPVIVQRLRTFLYLYVKRVGFKFFCDVMSSEESILKFLKLTVERMKCAMSYSEPKRVFSPSDTNFLIPRGGPDPSVISHHSRRYQPYGQQPLRHQAIIHMTNEPFGTFSVPSPAVGESGRSPYHIEAASVHYYSDGTRSWPSSGQVDPANRIPGRDESIISDLDTGQDFSSDLLEFLSNTSVLPELNFNTDLDFSVVRDDLDAMERCLFVRSAPNTDSVSDFSASNSPMSYSASQSPPTPRHLFSPNIQDDKLRRCSFSDSESSERSFQIVPNVSVSKKIEERNFKLNIEDGSESLPGSPVQVPNGHLSPNSRFVSSPLSAHMDQLTVTLQDVEPKFSVLRFGEPRSSEDTVNRGLSTPPPSASSFKNSQQRRESCEPSPPKRFLTDRPAKEPKIAENSKNNGDEKQKFVFPIEFKSAREEISSLLEAAKKEECMRHIAKLPEKDLLQIDEDGDTQLMILVSSDDQFSHEQLYALVERLRHYPQLFLVRNKQGLTALFMAMWRNRPLVAGYLAETMADLGLDLGITYKKGNTIFHYIALVGDDMAMLLAYLARVKKNSLKQAVNFNIHNHNGRTPVHEAVVRHGAPASGEGSSRERISCTKIIEIMCAYGANPGEGDRTSGKGAIHAAVEKRELGLIELLLRMAPLCSNARMYNNNTPLHYASTLPNISEEEQFKIIRLLLEKGADKTLRNAQKKLPIELVCQEHQKVKMLLQARAKKQFRMLCSQQIREASTSKPS